MLFLEIIRCSFKFLTICLIVILTTLHALGQPKLPTNFEEDTWAILKDAITAIFLKQKLSCDVEKLYQVIFITYTQRFHALL
jgi:hypothetical protein